MTAWLSLAISLVAIAIAVIVIRRMVDRRASSTAVMDEIRREVGAILTEMNQTTERNIELIEDRVTRLQELIVQADRRLGTLRRETQKQEKAEMVYSHLSRVARSAGSPPADGGNESSTNKGAQSSGGAEPSDASGEVAQTATSVPLKDRVLDLYRQGIPIERIASRVGTAVSEIELIVSLGERQ
ncbi:MAG: hypothetical protein KAU31_10535 [Spirochaetaceae bacterium]|nr:hypothetical protein [Spirochaetaceae bacterium]